MQNIDPKIKLAVQILCFAVVGWLILLATVLGTDYNKNAHYTSDTPTKQGTYNFERENAKNALKTLCVAWQDLSRAKAYDTMNLAGEQGRAAEFEQNAQVDCGSVEAPVSF